MKIISKAFSLIELATAIGILVIILGLGALWYQKVRQSYFPVEKNAFLIKRVLESAREFALLGKENTPWSVYIVSRINKNDLLKYQRPQPLLLLLFLYGKAKLLQQP